MTGDFQCLSSTRNSHDLNVKLEEINDDNDEKNICVVCQQLENADETNPVDMCNEEINNLLNIVYRKIAEWVCFKKNYFYLFIKILIFGFVFFVVKSQYIQIPTDIFGGKNKMSRSDTFFLKKLLFRKIMTKKLIAEKIETNQYGSLNEFYCDCLDIQHCIGILKGSKFILLYV